MRLTILAFIIMNVAIDVGCSSTPTRSTTSQVNPAEVKKYTQSMVALQADNASHLACPANVAAKAPWTTWASAANACVKVGNWVKVEEYGNELAKREYNAPWGAYYLSLAATERGDLLRARWMLDLAIKKAPSIGLFQYQLARLYYLNHDTGAAVTAFMKSVEMDSGLYEANLFLGQIYTRDQDWDRAIPQFDATLRIDPRNAQALVARAECYVQKNDGRHAEQSYQSAVGAYPDEMTYRLRLAYIQEKMNNDPEQALSTYREMQAKLDVQPVAGLSATVREKIKALEMTVQKTETKKPQTDRTMASQKPQSTGESK
jgi:tetratricopeptide (TPR) repeat protein